MATAIPMTNPTTGEMSTAFQGVSWTCFFFGPFPALFRGHIMAFILMLMISIVTFGFSGLVFMFLYNGWHKKWLMGKGFVPQHTSTAFAAASSQNVINVHVGNNNAQQNEGHGVQATDVPQGNSALPTPDRINQLPSGNLAPQIPSTATKTSSD